MAVTPHTAPTEATAPNGAAFTITPQQIKYFETFGFLAIPGLFTAEMDRITAGFEGAFAANATWDTNVGLHFGEQRSILPQVVSLHEDLSWLLDDARVHEIVSKLLDPQYEYAESDGNIFSCDTSWHADNYAAPLEKRHLKLSFYLDPLDAETGAIRMIPGTNHFLSPYAKTVRQTTLDPAKIPEIYGVEAHELPSYVLKTQPGDLVVWNFRIVHASFGGGNRRRLFSLNYRAIDND